MLPTLEIPDQDARSTGTEAPSKSENAVLKLEVYRSRYIHTIIVCIPIHINKVTNWFHLEEGKRQ